MARLATYRLQLNSDFGFDDAAALAPYLAALGVSHVYCSPYLQANRGSSHGYDVVDPTRLSQDLGGEAAHRRMCDAFAAAGLGQVLDIVPNHMAIAGRRNHWWWDVLENGPASVYASYFDVDWDPPEHKLHNRVLMPILDDHYGRVLEAGRLRLEREGGSFTVRFEDHALPVAPDTLDLVLAGAAEACGSDELAFLSSAAARLPRVHVTDRKGLLQRHREKEVLRRRLDDLLGREPAVAVAVDGVVAAINAVPDRLDSVLERQNYRVARWRTAGWELSYRRFFDINNLAALRVEEDHVFEDTHALVLRWVREGVLDGLRVDHPDGLRDPEAYFRRLRREAGEAWLVAEKVLLPGERLPMDWPIDGTTGYDFLNRAGGLFVDPRGAAPLERTWAEFTGAGEDFEQLAYRKKHQAMEDLLAADVNRLTELLVRVCERNRRYRDYTRPELNHALREAIACLPVYRTYASTARGRISDTDRQVLAETFERARRGAPEIEPDLFEFLHRVLRLEARGPAEDELVDRFQQTTGPVMAKGVEDTAFYSHLRLVALNEVGANPGRFGVAPEDFQRACEEAASAWPAGMLTSSTHDTKRSEDVRARLYLLSEIPGPWTAAVGRWAEMNRRHRSGRYPDPGAEYLLYQTLVGAHPLGGERAREYLLKALREAKERTSWTAPDEAYEAAAAGFLEDILADDDFTADLERFVEPLVWPGRVNSLAVKLLTLTAPGVPDLYQGSELWDLSLVDPDNRRPVDYERRRTLLGSLNGDLGAATLDQADSGLPKLLVVKRALEVRRRRPEAFAGDYRPLLAAGAKASHLVAFCRGGGAVTVVPRLVLGLGGDWGDTSLALPDGEWRDVLGGRAWRGDVPAGDLLGSFPVALLERV